LQKNSRKKFVHL